MLIRHKIFAAFGAMGAIVGAIALVAILNHEAIRYDLSQVGKAALEKPALVEEAVNALQELKFETEIAAARSIARPGELPRAPAVGAGALDDFDRRLAACRTAAEQSLALLKLEGLPSEIKVGEDELRAIGEVEALSASFRHRLATATKEDSVGALHRAGYDELLRRLNEYRAQVGRQAQAEIADVETGLRHADSATLWSSVALLLFGAAIAVFSATVLVRPIQSLTKTVRQIAAGEHQSLIAVHSRDEFGALTESFNAMLDQIQSQEKELRAAHDDLEQRVTERTAELQREIGERVRVAAELNNTMARLTAIWESAPLSIMILEPNDPAVPVKIVDCNPMACAMHGYTREEMIGQSVDLIEATPWARNVSNWIESFRQTSRFEGESQHRRKDGSLFDIEYFTSLIVVGGRELVIGMDRDATARKEGERALEQMHRQLMSTSRQAGMAEVATGVLHNVGNVLNSINVSATLVADQVRRSKAVNLARVCELFDQHKGDLPAFLETDPKGKVIPSYLSSLAESLASERQTIVAELEDLRKNIEHVKEIVSMQQSYAKTSGVNETISIPDMVEDALRINSGSLARHDVDIARDYVARPVATLDKHKVIQILINLIRNAKYACDESGRNDKLITVRTTADDQWVRIAVIDNGVGIPEENLTRIFSHGFTTREHGHGFGLHSGALAAKELGGALVAQSKGPGHGAIFTLELPFKPETAPHAKH